MLSCRLSGVFGHSHNEVRETRERKQYKANCFFAETDVVTVQVSTQGAFRICSTLGLCLTKVATLPAPLLPKNHGVIKSVQ